MCKRVNSFYNKVSFDNTEYVPLSLQGLHLITVHVHAIDDFYRVFIACLFLLCQPYSPLTPYTQYFNELEIFNPFIVLHIRLNYLKILHICFTEASLIIMINDRVEILHATRGTVELSEV